MTWAPVKFFWQHSLHDLSAVGLPGYEADNMLDGVEGTFWKPPTAQSTYSIVFDAGSGGSIGVDYFWMANHNLKTVGGFVELQRITSSNTEAYFAWTQVQCGATARYAHSSVVVGGEMYVFGGQSYGGSYLNDLWKAFTFPDSAYYHVYSATTVIGAAVPSDNGAFLKDVSSASGKAWRVVVSSCTAVPFIALMQWGRRTDLGHLSVDVDPHAQEFVANVNVGITGYILGVHEYSVQRNLKVKIEAADDALYQKYAAWRDGSRLRQFMVAWETSSHGSDVWLMYRGRATSDPMRVGGLYRNVEIDLYGRKAE